MATFIPSSTSSLWILNQTPPSPPPLFWTRCSFPSCSVRTGSTFVLVVVRPPFRTAQNMPFMNVRPCPRPSPESLLALFSSPCSPAKTDGSPFCAPPVPFEIRAHPFYKFVLKWRVPSPQLFYRWTSIAFSSPDNLRNISLFLAPFFLDPSSF